ncbi:MepB family protein [Membranihabitans maritimus]|uniref:MepB family protein n=1 Tax=Membranihabitans maritimus TaxID=2904244 RepID=UPI001F47B172|nr:MepB family protein [Membranihabitans maritimus]
MDPKSLRVIKNIYDQIGFVIFDFFPELEGKEYNACQFTVNGRKVLCRNAKITPKKKGQFVTFWKRLEKGSIAPFSDTDPIDFYIVNVSKEKFFGQFVFPKSVLIEKGIITTESKEGKRAFRVYPKWDSPTNKQSIRTQKWQLKYFYEISKINNFDKIRELYNAR